jgi:hypothetical protein
MPWSCPELSPSRLEFAIGAHGAAGTLIWALKISGSETSAALGSLSNRVAPGAPRFIAFCAYVDVAVAVVPAPAPGDVSSDLGGMSR